MKLNISLLALNNGTWVATLTTPAGRVLSVDAPSPADATLKILETTGLDKLAVFVRESKDRQLELATLKDEYDGMLQVMSGLSKNVRSIATKLKEDYDGRNQRQLLKELEQLVAPWPH